MSDLQYIPLFVFLLLIVIMQYFAWTTLIRIRDVLEESHTAQAYILSKMETAVTHIIQISTNTGE